MSVAMMTILLNERGLYAEALPALDFMKTGGTESLTCST